MIGTHVLRKLSALIRPPGAPFAHGESCPSSQVIGVMKLKSAVVSISRRSTESRLRFTTFFAHDGESMIEWKYINGLWRVAYESPRGTSALGACGLFVRSTSFNGGCPHVASSRVGSLPISPS